LFLPGERILLAVSGGMDSVAMARLFHQAGFSFGIAHVNFSLRGEESDREEHFVRSLAQGYGVPFFSVRFDTAAYAKENGLSIQMAARELRYRWFLAIRQDNGYQYVATAHHLDDQAETFLINLARGTGLAGLHGIFPKKGDLIRPMLFTDRPRIARFIRENSIAYMEDSSNEEIKYQRNRIRHRVIPEMEKLNPRFRQELGETINRIREAGTIYRKAVEAERARLVRQEEKGELRIPIGELLALQPLNTWVYELLQPYGFTPGTVANILLAAGNEPGKYFHSTSHRLLVDREELIIVPSAMVTGQDDGWELGFDILTGRGAIHEPLELAWDILDEAPERPDPSPLVAMLDADKLEFPLRIRRWRPGDAFYPLGMKKPKKLSDFFIDIKLSRLEKEQAFLLCSGDQIAWVIGHRIDDRFRMTFSTKRVLALKVFSEKA